MVFQEAFIVVQFRRNCPFQRTKDISFSSLVMKFRDLKEVLLNYFHDIKRGECAEEGEIAARADGPAADFLMNLILQDVIDLHNSGIISRLQIQKFPHSLHQAEHRQQGLWRAISPELGKTVYAKQGKNVKNAGTG